MDDVYLASKKGARMKTTAEQLRAEEPQIDWHNGG